MGLTIVLSHIKYLYIGGRGGVATSKVGGGGGTNKKGTFWKKGHLQREISQRKYNFCLDIGIYPYNVITLSGMISLYASYEILLKHHTLQLA